MTDPFGPANLSLLAVTTKAIQGVILNCWPRMSEDVYRIELVRALALCWINIRDDDSGNLISDVKADQPGIGDVEHELKIAAQLLVDSVQGKVDISELEPLRASDKRLAELFPSHSKRTTHDTLS